MHTGSFLADDKHPATKPPAPTKNPVTSTVKPVKSKLHHVETTRPLYLEPLISGVNRCTCTIQSAAKCHG